MENKKAGKILKIGKIDPYILHKFFSSLSCDNSVVVGPRIGEDAAVINAGGKYLVIKTDPITFTSRNMGWYVVNINANDIACMGAVPHWFLATVLLPPGEKKDFLEEFFNQLQRSYSEMGICLIGGHTEVTSAVTRPVVVGQMIGELKGKSIITNTNAKIGDDILLTKGLAIEGTHLIYQEKKDELKEKIPSRFLKNVDQFLKNPGISVVKEATIAAENVDVHCMHDPTEGGLIAGLWEIATASKVGICVKWEDIPIFEETKLICEKYKINPLSLLASGSLIVVTSPQESDRLISIYRENGIKCRKIGKIVSPEKGVSIVKGGEIIGISKPPKDELTKLVKNLN